MQQIKTEIIPVIHVEDLEQVCASIDICISLDINKVFLISHGTLDYNGLINLIREVKALYPKLWVGANFLDINANQAISLDLYFIDAIWTDASVSMDDYKIFRKFKGLHFGGLAFKYQSQPTDLEEACKVATITTDVATTSGSGTGQAPTTVKINNIRTHLGTHPMAIASGVSIDNIESYVGIVEYLMVASSITDNNEIINFEKLKVLKNKLDEVNGNNVR